MRTALIMIAALLGSAAAATAQEGLMHPANSLEALPLPQEKYLIPFYDNRLDRLLTLRPDLPQDIPWEVLTEVELLRDGNAQTTPLPLVTSRLAVRVNGRLFHSQALAQSQPRAGF